jgi:hypothetical protein
MLIRNTLLAILLLCSACANKPSPGSLLLHTRITEGGLKLFELTLPRAAHAEDSDAGPRPGERRPPEPGFSEKRVLAMLASVMEESRYCRAGYVLLGRYAGETTGRVRGECKDRATEEDRQQYPDSITRW